MALKVIEQTKVRQLDIYIHGSLMMLTEFCYPIQVTTTHISSTIDTEIKALQSVDHPHIIKLRHVDHEALYRTLPEKDASNMKKVSSIFRHPDGSRYVRVCARQGQLTQFLPAHTWNRCLRWSWLLSMLRMVSCLTMSCILDLSLKPWPELSLDNCCQPFR